MSEAQIVASVWLTVEKDQHLFVADGVPARVWVSCKSAYARRSAHVWHRAKLVGWSPQTYLCERCGFGVAMGEDGRA